MGIVRKFLQSLCLLPDLTFQGFFPLEIFFNLYKGGPLRIGCKYSEAGIFEYGLVPTKSKQKEFIVLIECFKKPPSFQLEAKGKQFIYNYIPNFPLLQAYIHSHNFLSFIKQNKIVTVINLCRKVQKKKNWKSLPGLYSVEDAKKDSQLKKFAQLISNVSNQLNYLPIFDFVNFLPEKVGKWGLVTIICFHRFLGMNGETHVVSNIQGNYQSGKRYANLLLRFVYEMAKDKIIWEDEGWEEKINGIKILKTKYDWLNKIFYLNKEKGYWVGISNNDTTLDFEKYESDFKRILIATIRKLKKYESIEATLKFINFLNEKKIQQITKT
jgi:hypothetical protein